MNKALADADRAMGDHFKAFRDFLPPDQVPAVVEEQRDWVKARNQACPAKWSDLDTYAFIESAANCLLEQTKFFYDAMQSQ